MAPYFVSNSIRESLTNIWQWQIVKNLGLLASVEQNISNDAGNLRKCDSGKNKGRNHCWIVGTSGSTAGEIFITPYSVDRWNIFFNNTVHLWIQNQNLDYTKKKTYTNSVETVPRVLWIPVHFRWTEKPWTCVLWTDVSTFQLIRVKTAPESTFQRWERSFRLLSKKKAAILLRTLVSMEDAICVMQRWMLEFWRDICCHQRDIFRKCWGIMKRRIRLKQQT